MTSTQEKEEGKGDRRKGRREGGGRREEVQREEVEKEGGRENFSYALVVSISKQPSRTVAGPKQG